MLITILSNCAWVPITINSVLSSFSLSLSAIIQVLMFRMQSCNAVTTSNSLTLEPGLNEIITGYRLCMHEHLGGGISLPQIACWHKL